MIESNIVKHVRTKSRFGRPQAENVGAEPCFLIFNSFAKSLAQKCEVSVSVLPCIVLCSDVDPGVRAELPVHLLGRPGPPHRHPHPLLQDVRYGTGWYGTVRYGTVRYGTVRYGAGRYGTVRPTVTLILSCRMLGAVTPVPMDG
jgi:hypothetical protein